MTPQEKAAQIKAHAVALGFDACGIAVANPIDSDRHFETWLANGYHADMAWLARDPEIRSDIRLKLPEAKSVVVLAQDYDSVASPLPPNSGRVARYARGKDYHTVLREPVHTLAEQIRQLEPNTTAYVSIDTGPVLEKAWAARAGLGWIGKHSLLIRPEAGSFCVLAVIATTLELTADPPVAEQCHGCSRCLDACPTRALVAPGILDARRCLSYQTIEHRGAIPEMFHEAMGDVVFGCDRCQEVCPWNQHIPLPSHDTFRPQNDAIDLDAIAAMSETEFKERFRETPLYRARLEGLQRNAAIVRQNRNKQE